MHLHLHFLYDSYIRLGQAVKYAVIVRNCSRIHSSDKTLRFLYNCFKAKSSK